MGWNEWMVNDMMRPLASLPMGQRISVDRCHGWGMICGWKQYIKNTDVERKFSLPPPYYFVATSYGLLNVCFLTEGRKNFLSWELMLFCEYESGSLPHPPTQWDLSPLSHSQNSINSQHNVIILEYKKYIVILTRVTPVHKDWRKCLILWTGHTKRHFQQSRTALVSQAPQNCSHTSMD